MRLLSRHPWVADLAIGAILAQCYLASVRVGDEFGQHAARAWTGWDFGAAVAVFGLIGVRRQWPRAVLGLSVVGSVLSMAAGETWAALIPVAVIAAYTVAAHQPRLAAWLYGGSAALLLYGASALWSGPESPGTGWWQRGNFGVFAVIGMAVAIGDAIRTRRAYVAAVEERARRAEESREEEAHRRVIGAT
jgi:hypothetical protein